MDVITPKKLAKPFESPLTIPPSPFMTKLGCGTGVVVYRFERTNRPSSMTWNSPWAVKKVRKDLAYCSDRLKREAEILRNLDHPNIVTFKGTALSQAGEFCLSMEDCDQSLDKIIEARNDQGELMLRADEVLQVAAGVIRALSYLHDIMKLLHGDVKSGNVLIKGDFSEIKLCDFGVCIYLKDDLSGPRDPDAVYIGTEPWHSYEVLEWNDGPITDKADIFSYGLVIWEMLTLRCPHLDLIIDKTDVCDSLEGSFLSDSMNETSEEYYNALGTRPPLPDLEYGPEYDRAVELFVCCTHTDYEARPSATTVALHLADI